MAARPGALVNGSSFLFIDENWKSRFSPRALNAANQMTNCSLFIPLIFVLAACTTPLCDNKDHLTPWQHIEHWSGTHIEEPAPIAVITETVEQAGCLVSP